MVSLELQERERMDLRRLARQPLEWLRARRPVQQWLPVGQRLPVYPELARRLRVGQQEHWTAGMQPPFSPGRQEEWSHPEPRNQARFPQRKIRGRRG